MDIEPRRASKADKKVENFKILSAARNQSFKRSQNTSKISDDSVSFTNRAFNDQSQVVKKKYREPSSTSGGRDRSYGEEHRGHEGPAGDNYGPYGRGA